MYGSERGARGNSRPYRTRRDFITLLGGAAVAWPLATRAQQMPVIGFLRSTPSASFMHFLAAFQQGLKDEGFIDGQNVAIEQRWADNQLDRLPGLAADLVRRQVAVIVANTPAAKAAKAATQTIPIVFVTGEDPVTTGLVDSLNRPSGNLTGVVFFASGHLGTKRLELMHDLVPKGAVIGVLMDPSFASELPAVETAARALGRQLLVIVMKAASERELDAAFSAIVQAGAGGLVIGGGPFFTSQRRKLVALAASHAIPAIYDTREAVEAGGLMSYGTSATTAYRQAGLYAGRILKGAKTSELPVMQPTTFELVINLKTAKTLGLTLPMIMQMTADEVIE